MLLFLIVVIYYGIAYMPRASIFKTPILRIPGTLLYSMPWIGSLLMLFELIIDVIGVSLGITAPFKTRQFNKIGIKKFSSYDSNPSEEEKNEN